VTPTGQRKPHEIRRQATVLRIQAAEAAKRARRQLLLLVPLLIGVLVAYAYRIELFGTDKPVRFATAAALILIGWSVAHNLGQAFEPRMERRLGPGAAGVTGFVLRLATLFLSVFVGLRIAGLDLGALALGASFTAVIVGLAAQQTFGNLFAGVMLLSTRPFHVGDRVRFHGYGMDVEGTVTAHGLLYVTLTDGDDFILVPNNTALAMSVRPLRQPPAVNMRARLPFGVDPEMIEERVSRAVTVQTKGLPDIVLEELDGDEIVVRIRATPADRREGGRLAREVLEAVAALRRGADRAGESGDSADEVGGALADHDGGGVGVPARDHGHHGGVGDA
jgi:small-conductance mechanosensitive channel